ncbi:MAG: single-stranded-DNA-specific exonuclease RecJ [Gemmatimonadota bacterium]
MTRAPGSSFRAPPPRWELSGAPDETRAARLAHELSLPVELCRILVARGHADSEAARRFLRPRVQHLTGPETLVDLPRAVQRIDEAVRSGEQILVHGDYDVDGVCAAALLTRWIRRLGGQVEAFVPHRMRDGYDLGAGGLARAREVGASLLITVDCGIVAHEAVAQARAQGIDVIVTDHHAPGASLPPAVAVVNPNRSDDGSNRGGLCGAGVAFQLCRALAETRGVPAEELLQDLDLVALATVADLVPLRGENRVLVRFGLRALERTRKPGLRALLEVCGLEGIPEAGKVGFTLAPRINAMGRMDDAGRALRLLLTEDPDEARQLASLADEVNGRRQDEDRRTLAEALELLEGEFDPERDWGVVLAREGWHPGVIGIVASRMVERLHRPVVLVALEGEGGRGSARSIPGFHLHGALTRCAPFLRRFGGHAAAAGMELDRDRLDEFRAGFNQVVRGELDPELLRPSLRVDLEVDPGALTLELADLARYLGPHGIGNPRPVLLARNLRVDGAREVGRGHLKMRLGFRSGSVDAIGFGLVERFPPSDWQGELVDLVFQLSVNEYRGRRTPQLKVLDVRRARAAGTTAASGSSAA